jgi:hypothetical protein
VKVSAAVVIKATGSIDAPATGGAKGKKPSREESLRRQARAWELWQDGASLAVIAEDLGVEVLAARRTLRKEHAARALDTNTPPAELEKFRQTIGLGEPRGACGLDASEKKRQWAARKRAAKRRASPSVVVRVSQESIYLPGQLVELIGGPGDSDGGCVRVRSTQTRGEYFLPKVFLESGTRV